MNAHDAPALPEGARPAEVVTWRGGVARPVGDALVDEVPVALVFNGISHAVMLATPTALEDFALGFGLTEGLLAGPHELYDLDRRDTADGIELHLQVSAACEHRLKARRRAMAGRTGCGLCGTESLAQVRQVLPPAARRGAVQVAPAALARALHELRAAQLLSHVTGAAHAAAWCDMEGHARLVREDIGRHNALDKLVGAMVRAQVPAAEGFIAVTSRASFEMVQKTAMAGAAMLVAVSAPSALAVRVAAEAGVALAGFARGDDFVAYTHPERFGLPAPEPASSLAPR